MKYAVLAFVLAAALATGLALGVTAPNHAAAQGFDYTTDPQVEPVMDYVALQTSNSSPTVTTLFSDEGIIVRRLT